LRQPPKKPATRLKRLKEWFDEFLDSEEAPELSRFILVVPWEPDTLAQEWAVGVSAKLEVDVWDRTELDRRIAPYPEVIHRFFGPAYVAEAAVYDGKRMAAYISQGETYLGVEALAEEAARLAGSGEHLASARVFGKRAAAFRLLNLGVQAEKAEFQQAHQFRAAGQQRDAERLELRVVASHIDAGAIEQAEGALRHVRQHDGWSGQASNALHLAQHVNQACKRLTTNEDHLLDCVAQAMGDDAAWLCLIAAEVAVAAQEQDAVEQIGTRLDDLGPFVDTGLEVRRAAVLVDAGLRVWEPPSELAEGAAGMAGFACARNGRRIWCHLDIGSQMSEVADAIQSFRAAASWYLRRADFGAAASAWQAVVELQMSFAAGDPEQWGADDEQRRSLYSQQRATSPVEKLMRAAGDLLVSGENRANQDALERANAAARIAAVRGRHRDELNALGLASRAAFELGDHRESLRLAVLAGDGDQAKVAAEGLDQLEFSPEVLTPTGIRRRKAHIAAIAAAPPVWASDEAAVMVEPLVELVTKQIRGLQTQPSGDALAALAKIAPCLRSAMPLFQDLKSRHWKNLSRAEEAGARDLFYWIAHRLTDRQLTDHFDGFVSSTPIEPRAIKAAVGVRLRRLPESRDQLLQRLAEAGRSELVESLTTRAPATAKEAAETKDRILQLDRHQDSRMFFPRSIDGPHASEIARWRQKDAVAVIEHLLFLADGPLDLVTSKADFLRTAAHIARWKPLQARDVHRLTQTALALRTGDTGPQHVFVPARSDYVERAALTFVAAVHQKGRTPDSELKSRLTELVFSEDDEDHSLAGDLLSELLHKDIHTMDVSLLVHHPAEGIRARAALAALFQGDIAVVQAIAHTSGSPKRALAQHITQLRQLGKPGDVIVRKLRKDKDGQVRTLASSPAAQCQNHD